MIPLAGLILLPAQLLADFATMLDTTKNIEQLFGRFRSTNSNFNVISSSMLNINGYGCWCYFEKDDIHKGKGEPVDEIDQFCRYLLEGYQCSHMDFENESSENNLTITESNRCYPWLINYNAGVDIGNYYNGADPKDILVGNCKERNPDNSCAERSCIIEGYLVMNIVDAFFQGIKVDDSLRHSNGFEVEKRCKKPKPHNPFPTEDPNNPDNGGNGNDGSNNGNTTPPLGDGKNIKSGDLACCGEYPIRAPYNTEHRGCCGLKSYNAYMMECCNNLGSYEIKTTC